MEQNRRENKQKTTYKKNVNKAITERKRTKRKWKAQSRQKM